MKSKGQMALAVGAGYMLGRTHRMKMALMLAAAGATGRFPGGPRDLLERGTKMLVSSPEVAKIGDTVREELVSAAKAAAVTAASQRIDALSNRLLAGSDTVTGAVDGVGKVSGTVGEVAGVGRFGRRKTARTSDDEHVAAGTRWDEGHGADSDEDVVDAEIIGLDDEAPGDETEERPPRTRPATRRTSSTRSARPTGKARKTDPSHSDEEAPKRSDGEKAPKRSTRTRVEAPTDSAPVRRVRR